MGLYETYMSQGEAFVYLLSLSFFNLFFLFFTLDLCEDLFMALYYNVNTSQ